MGTSRVTRSVGRMPLLVMLLLVMLLAGCDLQFGEQRTGSLVLTLGGNAKGSGTQTVWNAGISTEIVSYRVTLTHSTAGIVVSNVALPRGSDPVAVHVMDALAPGVWTVEIEAYNDIDCTGDRIAYLEENSSGERCLKIPVERGKVSTVSALVVPIDDEDKTGALTIEVDWSAVDESLLLQNPEIRVSLSNINNKLGRYSTPQGTETILLECDAAGKGRDSLGVADEGDTLTLGQLESLGIAPLTLDAICTDATLEFSGLPSGWYEVVVGAYSNTTENPDKRYWQGVFFAHVVHNTGNIATPGTITLVDSLLEVGSIDISITEDMQDPLSVTVSINNEPWDEQSVYDADPGVEVSFVCSISDAQNYLWYVNGDRIDSAATQAYAPIFTETGTYTVVVSVFNDGSWGACSTQVLVAYETGDTGPAGGLILYDKGSFDDGWRYLEVAQEDLSVQVGSDLVDLFAWSNVDNAQAGAIDTDLGAGLENTGDIIHQDGHAASAAMQCEAHSEVVGGEPYADWYLPSYDELELMYDEFAAKSEGNFKQDWYWCSSEDATSGGVASWMRNMDQDVLAWVDSSKNAVAYVRPLRRF